MRRPPDDSVSFLGGGGGERDGIGGISLEGASVVLAGAPVALAGAPVVLTGPPVSLAVAPVDVLADLLLGTGAAAAGAAAFTALAAFTAFAALATAALAAAGIGDTPGIPVTLVLLELFAVASQFTSYAPSPDFFTAHLTIYSIVGKTSRRSAYQTAHTLRDKHR